MTGKEASIIKQNYKTEKGAILSQQLGITEDCLRMRAKRLGISKRISHEIRYKVDLVLDMIENIRENKSMNKDLSEVLRKASNDIFIEIDRQSARS